MKTLTNSEDLSDNRIKISVPASFPAIYFLQCLAEILFGGFPNNFQDHSPTKEIFISWHSPFKWAQRASKRRRRQASLLYFSFEGSAHLCVHLSHRTQLHGNRYTVKHPPHGPSAEPVNDTVVWDYFLTPPPLTAGGILHAYPEAVGHEREISNAER